MTGTFTVSACFSFNSDTKLFARTTSKVETPNNLRLSYTPFLRNISAANGTNVFTGLLTIPTHASGHTSATFSTKFLMMLPLILNKSARVMPGLRATPAVINTICASFNAAAKFSSPA